MPANMISKILEKSSVLPLVDDVIAPIHVKTAGGAPRTSVLRNPNMEKLQKGYLFPEISIKREAHLKKYPDAKVISLGIGDTTEPIPSVVTSAMAEVFLFFCELRFFLITLLPSFSAEHEHACMHARESLSQCKAA